MRILYSCPLDPVGQAAAGGHVINIVKELAHLGHTVTLIHMGSPLSDLDGVRQIALGNSTVAPTPPIWRNIKLGREIAREWRSGAYDVVYHRFDKSTVLPPLVARLWRMPLVVEVNSDLRSEPYLLRKSRLQHSLIQFIERMNYLCANHIIVVAEGIKHSLRKVYGLVESKITVVSNGADLDVIMPMHRDACCQSLGLELDRRYSVFTGTFQVWQGLETIIEAYVHVRKTHPEAACLLIGDGPERPNLEARISALGLSSAFCLPGWCSPQQVALYLGASDLCLAPYANDAAATPTPGAAPRGALMRGSPLKVYTYLAAGRPVVASHFQEVGLLVEEIGAGLSIPPERPDCLAEAICHILENPQEAERMGRTAREVAEQRYGWRAVAERVADICGQVRCTDGH